MKKIKLLYAIGSSCGGAFKNVTDLATHLDQESFEIYLILSDNKPVLETQVAIAKIKKKNVNIKCIDISPIISLFDIISFVKIYFYLKKSKFDIVHAHSSKAGALFRLAAFLAKVPVVMYTPHCYYFTAFSGYKRTFYLLLERLLARFTHQTVISGTEQKAANDCHVEKRNVSIINNAIDISTYEKEYAVSEIKKQLNIPTGHCVIIGVGRLVKQKNWNMFIDAARIVLSGSKEMTFVIAGDGPYKNRLNKQITKYGLESQIKLIGYIENISIVYAIADLFVSTSKWEGLPYAYLEALYFEVPMIITKTEGIGYFLKKGNCICVPQEDPGFLANEIMKKISLLSDKIPANENYPFLLTNCIKQYEKLYRNLYYTLNE